MGRYALRSGCAILAIATIAGCSSNDKKSETVVVNQPGPANLNGFGTQFAAAYRADPNSEPYTPADGDVPALSLTTEPVPVD